MQRAPHVYAPRGMPTIALAGGGGFGVGLVVFGLGLGLDGVGGDGHVAHGFCLRI